MTSIMITMLRFFYFSVIGVILITLAGCQGQSTSPFHIEEWSGSREEPTIQLASIPTDNVISPYTLSRGDEFQLLIPGIYEESTFHRVEFSGEIHIPFVNPVMVEGLTVRAAELKIQEALSVLYRNPYVYLIPRTLKSNVVSIYGEVKAPGTYELSGSDTIMEVLAKAGGLKLSMENNIPLIHCDLKKSLLIRHEKMIPIDFERLIYHGDMRWNIHLQRGDQLVFVTKEPNKVYMLGDFMMPKTVSYFSNISLIKAVATVGGVKPSSSGLIIIVRGSLARPRIYKISMDDLVHGRIDHFALSAGDIVYAPHDKLYSFRKVFEDILTAYSRRAMVPIFRDTDPLLQTE